MSLSLSRWPQRPAGDLFSSRYVITLAILRGGLLRGCMKKVSSFSKKQDSKNKERGRIPRREPPNHLAEDEEFEHLLRETWGQTEE